MDAGEDVVLCKSDTLWLTQSTVVQWFVLHREWRLKLCNYS